MTSADVVAHAADEDQNAIVYQLTEEETAEILNEDVVFTTKNRFDEAKDAQTENSEIPNEVELEEGNIAEDLAPEVQDVVNKGNQALEESKNGNILNPETTNPEINPNNPTGETLDDITNNLPNSEEVLHEEMAKNAKTWGIAGGAGVAVLGLGVTGIAVGAKYGAKKGDKKAKKSVNDFFMGGN